MFRATVLIATTLLACDAEPEQPPAPITIKSGAAARPAGAPSTDDVCKAYLTLSAPPHVIAIAASATEGAIKPAPDGSGMKAQIVELRAETGPVENGKRRIDGISLTRELTLRNDGGTWTVINESDTSRSELFYLHKTPDHDPRTLFGASVIERYGPKGGTPCALPTAPSLPSATSAEICAAFYASDAAKAHTVLVANATVGFTAPEQGEDRNPPTLGEGQAAATIHALRVESTPAEGKLQHALVTRTENLVLAREGAAWKVASTQLVFRGEYLRDETPPDGDARAVFDDAETLAKYKPTHGTTCTPPTTK
jgi:hypothetical protein